MAIFYTDIWEGSSRIFSLGMHGKYVYMKKLSFVSTKKWVYFSRLNKLSTVRFRALKGIVSQDFGGLQMILMDRIGVPDVQLEVYSFLNFCFHIVI